MAAPTIYIVTDIRTVPDGDGFAVVTNTTQHTDRLKAEARYHTALAGAANNDQYPMWAAALMTNDGDTLEHRCFEHDVQPAPEPEPEAE